jgi:hypothetical protein
MIFFCVDIFASELSLSDFGLFILGVDEGIVGVVGCEI